MNQALNTSNAGRNKEKFNFLEFLKKQNGWLFVLPAVILMCVFTFYPIIGSLISAFKVNYQGLTGKFDGWGVSNFKAVLTGYDIYGNPIATGGAKFLNCLWNTLLFTVVSVPVSTLLALLISVALNSIKPLQKAYQTIFFLPYLTNALAMGAVFATFFKVIQVNTSTPPEYVGLFNNFLHLFGVEPIKWLTKSTADKWGIWANRFVVVVYEIWAGMPFKILILFSALQNVNKQYYDAAKVDGASKSTILWKITVPLISPMLSYLLVTGIMGGMKAYSAIVGIFGQDMHDMRMGTMVGYIYFFIEEGGKTGYAAAGALILFVIIMIITALNLYISKKKVHY